MGLDGCGKESEAWVEDPGLRRQDGGLIWFSALGCNSGARNARTQRLGRGPGMFLRWDFYILNGSLAATAMHHGGHEMNRFDGRQRACGTGLRVGIPPGGGDKGRHAPNIKVRARHNTVCTV